MGSHFSCIKSDDVSDSVYNLHTKEKGRKKEKEKEREKEKGKRKGKTNKTSSSPDQTSQHVTSTSEPEVLPIAEEPGHAEVNDELSDDVFQDLVGDLSEWSADILYSLSCILSGFNDYTLQTRVATDLSVDLPQATVSATSDYRVPIRDVADYRANVPRVPVRDVAYYRANVPRDPVCVVADCSVDPVPAISDCRFDVPQGPVSTTPAPGFDVADCCVDVPQVIVYAISDCRDDVPQILVQAASDPVCATSDCRVDAPHASVRPTEETVSPQFSQPEDNEIFDVNSSSYEIVRKLGEGSFGSVYAGIRLTDGLKVALKFVDNMDIEWIDIEGYPEPVPREIGLLILANKGPRVPQIIQLVDWDEQPDHYVMVLERPTPCEDLIEFLDRHEGTIGEDVASVIMHQTALAAQTCCQRGVLHRDIKLENLLINPDTQEVKLIDFGCGEILTNAAYTSFAGTIQYCPPEYDINGEYYGEPATVWSLGILMFGLLCGKFPEPEDMEELNNKIWSKDGLSQECCELLCSLLQRNPENRIELVDVCLHDWFKYFNSQPEDEEIIEINLCSYEIGRLLGEGGFGSVYAGIRLTDGLEVALKFTHNMDIEWIDIEGYPEPVPQEIGLLILANKGPRVPQIIQLLDWVEQPDQYIMVLERPTPCEDLSKYLARHEGTIGEDVASVIMHQTALAAHTCCQRGVLHRDIKLENLLINPDTQEVKLIDFGCGEILTNAVYTSYAGTIQYCPPEYERNSEYHGKPATVWSLGILLFKMLCGKFPLSEDLEVLNDMKWTKHGLSQECCELLSSLLQTDPEKRIELKNVSLHNWFKYYIY